MRTILKDVIKKIYYWLGFYPPQRILPVREYYKHIKGYPEEIIEYQLQLLSLQIKNISSNKSNEYYNQLLKKFIPEWSLLDAQYRFIKNFGHGLGESSLATFRKVKIKNNILFEKVYFNSYLDLKNVLWFQKNIYPLLKNKIRIPEIKKVYEGYIISVAYFDYMELKPFKDKQTLISSEIKLSKDLYIVSKNNQEYIRQLDIENGLFDFRQHFLYKEQKKSAKNNLNKIGIDFDFLEKQISVSFLIINHGDIYKTNFYQENTLIDWDTFGFYPIGLEVAFLYQRLLWSENLKEENFSNWLKINYQETISEEIWNEFERNTFFFLYVFNQCLFEEMKYLNLKEELILELSKVKIHQ